MLQAQRVGFSAPLIENNGDKGAYRLLHDYDFETDLHEKFRMDCRRRLPARKPHFTAVCRDKDSLNEKNFTLF